MTMRITRLAPEVDGVAIGEPVTIITQANRIKGAAATIEVGAVTVGEADVSNSGTPNAAVLDFVIPRGPAGFTLIGDWGTVVEYAAFEAVTHAASTWYALVDNVGTEPGTDAETWHLVMDGSGAEADRAAAEAAASDAENARDLSIGAKDGAETAAGLAASAKTASETARDKAQDWAEEVEDTEVETGKYSALHHAAKAADSATLSEAWADGTEPGGPGTKSAREYAEDAAAAVDVEASAVGFTPVGTISATDVQAALAEIASEKVQSGASPSVLDMTTARILGRTTASTGPVEELTKANMLSFLNVADGSQVGDVTAAAAFAVDNRILTSDGTGKGAQASAATLDDNADLVIRDAYTRDAFSRYLRLQDSGLNHRRRIYIASDNNADYDCAINFADANITLNVLGTGGTVMTEFKSGSAIPTTGANVTVTNIDCDDLQVWCDAVSTDGTSVMNLYLSTDNGSSWSSALALSGTLNAAVAYNGGALLFGLRSGRVFGIRQNFVSAATAFPFMSTATPGFIMAPMGAKVNAIKIESGNTLDAGNVYLATRG